MGYWYIMINILTEEFDFGIANIDITRNTVPNLITNRSITVIPTSKESFIKSTDNNCVYGPCIRLRLNSGKKEN